MDEKEREQALFNCLRVPNDDVKIAVVSCLYYVPISQLTRHEFQEMIDILRKIQNVGVGRTEIVLSIMFQIMSNIIRDTSATFQETVKMFKKDFVKPSVDLAINIILKN